VLVTHPLDEQTPCVLGRTLKIDPDGGARLRLTVTHDGRGDWMLVVKANGQVLAEQLIGQETALDRWLTLEVDLSGFAGRTINLELENRPNGWSFEAGYWAEIAVVKS
jgi:hypothetical protein